MSARISGATERALEQIVRTGCSAYKAAKDNHIALSTIYRALGRHKRVQGSAAPADNVAQDQPATPTPNERA